MTRRIGGQVDARGLALLAGHVTDDDYRLRAEAHRPDDEGLRAEVLRLFHSGLRAQDIAAAVRVPLDTVQNWLAGAPA